MADIANDTVMHLGSNAALSPFGSKIRALVTRVGTILSIPVPVLATAARAERD
jgi:hypothetical protein